MKLKLVEVAGEFVGPDSFPFAVGLPKFGSGQRGNRIGVLVGTPVKPPT
jgi:hypothetical protein